MGAFLAADGFESVNENAIRKEGYLSKLSRHVGTWRLRWIVLHQQYLCTFAQSQHYTNPTEQIDLRQFNTLTPPVYNSSISAYIITLRSDTSSFTFKHSDEHLIHEWHDAIQQAIHASNDNLICRMLSAELLTGPIACYLIGYKRFQNLPLVNKHFSDLFRLHTFDFSGVYLTDSVYFMQHFHRFYHEHLGEHFIAIKQGLYRCMYNPQQQYNDVHVNYGERKPLLYLLMAYGALLKGGRKYRQLQGPSRASHMKHNPRRPRRSLVDVETQLTSSQDYEEEVDTVDSGGTKDEDDNEDDNEETKDDDTKDDDTKEDVECKEHHREHSRHHGLVVEIPASVTTFDFSRHLSNKTKLVALSFHEVRDDTDDIPARVMDTAELKAVNSRSMSTGDDDDDNQHHSYEDHKLGSRLPHDVKWICDLLTYAHVLTFEQIEVLDLSYNAWSNTDVIAMCDAILCRSRRLSLKQLKLDGIPLVTEVDACKVRAVRRLFAAISAKCNALQVLSLNHCLLRDDTCNVIGSFYARNPRTTLSTIYLINNNLTERGVDVLNKIAVRSSQTQSQSHSLAFVVGSFYSECANEWNASIITSDQYSC